MNRNFRLTGSTNFKRVRRSGKSYAHPLVVLLVLPASERISRFGVIAGRSLGGSVQRNRAKRMLREAVRAILPNIKPGWDVIMIARQPILGARFTDIKLAMHQLFANAGLLIDSNGS